MGLDKNATQAEVKAKYHALARQYHPDRAKDKEMGQRLFTQINLAYRTLSDPDRRSDYDTSLLQAASAVRTSSTAPQAATASQGVGAKTDPIRKAPTMPVNRTAQNPAPGPGQLTLEQALQKANGAYMNGDRRTAQQLCQNIIKADGKNAAAHVLLGDIYSDLGQRVEALTEYKTAVNCGDTSRLVQQKIQRLETQSAQPVRPPSSNNSGQTKPASPPAANSQAAPKKAPEPPKKAGFFDRIIGRGGK
jgi:hypothetical protein